MTNIETRLGLTPILKRLAYSYLIRGYGRYPITHGLYDTVVVAELYDWQVNPADTSAHGAGARVTFYKDNVRIRWVEFGIRFIGGGGDPVIFGIKATP